MEVGKPAATSAALTSPDGQTQLDKSLVLLGMLLNRVGANASLPCAVVQPQRSSVSTAGGGAMPHSPPHKLAPSPPPALKAEEEEALSPRKRKRDGENDLSEAEKREKRYVLNTDPFAKTSRCIVHFFTGR